MATSYKHTQVGWLMTLLLVMMLAITGYLAAMTNFRCIGVLLVAVFLISLANFACLSVSVDQEAVRLHFGVGLIRRAFPLADITIAQQVRNHWLDGFGIRYMWRDGMLYNIGGLDAVELRLANGRCVRIGTNDPAGLAAAVQERLAARN